MIRHYVEQINAYLAATGRTSSRRDGQEVPIVCNLSETAEDEEGDLPLVAVYPTSESTDYDLQRNPKQASIQNRVVQLQFVVRGLDMEHVEKMINSLLLACHSVGGGGALRWIGGVWDRTLRVNADGRKYTMTVAAQVPIVRDKLASANPGTRMRFAVEPLEPTTYVDVELATVNKGGVFAQEVPASVWRCVFPSERAGTFLFSTAGTPTVSAVGPRVVELTFPAPVIGRAHFTIE